MRKLPGFSRLNGSRGFPSALKADADRSRELEPIGYNWKSIPRIPTDPDNTDAYDAAMASVRQAIAQFDGCTDAERKELQRDLDQLHGMVEKLDRGRVEIVVFGEISTGKSALINALVGEAVADTSVRGGWTKDVWHLDWDGAGYVVPDWPIRRSFSSTRRA